jgi:hypothetical protein
MDSAPNAKRQKCPMNRPYKGRVLPEPIADLSMVLLHNVDIVDLRHCHFAHRIREQGLLWTRHN